MRPRKRGCSLSRNEQRAERVVCFKALKQSALAKAEGAVPANAEGTTREKMEHELRQETPTKPPRRQLSLQLPPQSIFSALHPANRCARARDTLAAMLIAGLLASDPAQAATPGCQTLPSDAKLELLERHPGVFPFMRMIKVKVTSPTKPDLTVGFTIEMGPLLKDRSSLKAPQ